MRDKLCVSNPTFILSPAQIRNKTQAVCTPSNMYILMFYARLRRSQRHVLGFACRSPRTLCVLFFVSYAFNASRGFTVNLTTGRSPVHRLRACFRYTALSMVQSEHSTPTRARQQSRRQPAQPPPPPPTCHADRRKHLIRYAPPHAASFGGKSAASRCVRTRRTCRRSECAHASLLRSHYYYMNCNERDARFC